MHAAHLPPAHRTLQQSVSALQFSAFGEQLAHRPPRSWLHEVPAQQLSGDGSQLSLFAMHAPAALPHAPALHEPVQQSESARHFPPLSRHDAHAVVPPLQARGQAVHSGVGPRGAASLPSAAASAASAELPSLASVGVAGERPRIASSSDGARSEQLAVSARATDTTATVPVCIDRGTIARFYPRVEGAARACGSRLRSAPPTWRHVDPETEAAATESQAASTDDCKPRPWQLLVSAASVVLSLRSRGAETRGGWLVSVPNAGAASCTGRRARTAALRGPGHGDLGSP